MIFLERVVLLVGLLCVLFQNVSATLVTGDTLPACGLKCFVTLVVPSSGCSLTDPACICSNVELARNISVCVASSCSIRDSLTTSRYSKHTCNVTAHDRTHLVWIIGLTGGGLALVAFTIRIWSRIQSATKLGADDYVLGFMMLEVIPFTVFSKVLADAGLGLDIWEVPFDNLTYILYIYFWDELIYLSALPLLKISLLLFYLRVFSTPSFRACVYFLIACNVAYCIAFVGVSIWQCLPIYGAWTRWDGTFEGTCNNINLQGWLSAALNIVIDMCTLLLPIPELIKLEMPRSKKVLIFLMFSVGFFVTIVSIIRLQTLVQFSDTSNFTQDYAPLGYWSTIEIHAGVICACMPAIRKVLQKWFPTGKVFSSSMGENVTGGTDLSYGLGSKHLTPPISVSMKPKSYDTESFVPLVDLEAGHKDGGSQRSRAATDATEPQSDIQGLHDKAEVGTAM